MQVCWSLFATSNLGSRSKETTKNPEWSAQLFEYWWWIFSGTCSIWEYLSFWAPDMRGTSIIYLTSRSRKARAFYLWVTSNKKLAAKSSCLMVQIYLVCSSLSNPVGERATLLKLYALSERGNGNGLMYGRYVMAWYLFVLNWPSS